MASLFTIECDECGKTTTARTAALAAHHHSHHSCEHQQRLRERAERVKARKEAEGRKRDCRHKHARHEHGTPTAYKADRCRCRECREANTADARARNKAIAYGRWDPGLVPTGPVLEHVHALQAAGIGTRTVAARAGVGRTTLQKILNGRARVARDVAERILALAPGDEAKAGHALVDATGTHRRIHALVASGRSVAALGGRLGMTTSNFHTVLSQPAVTAATARAVADLYDRLWDQPAPEGTSEERRVATRARNYAAAHGWAPPMAWDDDTIDDPTAQPAGTEQSNRTSARTADLAEDIEHMLATNASPEEVAQRLHRTVRDLDRILCRHGRHDLAAWLRTGHQPPDYAKAS